MLQRVLGGQRVACTPFREPGRRGYRFRASGSYAAMLDNSKTPTNVVAPTGCDRTTSFLQMDFGGVGLAA